MQHNVNIHDALGKLWRQPSPLTFLVSSSLASHDGKSGCASSSTRLQCTSPDSWCRLQVVTIPPSDQANGYCSRWPQYFSFCMNENRRTPTCHFHVQGQRTSRKERGIVTFSIQCVYTPTRPTRMLESTCSSDGRTWSKQCHWTCMPTDA